MRRISPQCVVFYASIYLSLLGVSRLLIQYITETEYHSLAHWHPNKSDHYSPKMEPDTAGQLLANSTLVPLNEELLKWDRPIQRPLKNITILLWNTYYRGSTEPQHIQKYAPVPRWCRITYDRRLQPSADAVVFHPLMSDLQPHTTDWPKERLGAFFGSLQRPIDQVWVQRVLESPAYATSWWITLQSSIHDFKWLNDVAFNRTMTYNLDSDFPCPYATVTRRTEADGPVDPDIFNAELSANKKSIAAMISHCDTFSRREILIRSLKAHIPVDTHGACGMKVCIKKAGDTEYECYAKLAKQYRFYLSFENSLCPHYITEKFSNALKAGMVPIVYGAGNYTKILPYPKSFIDVRDFDGNMTKLAEYIKYLNGNSTAYLEYLEWHKHYVVHVKQGFSGYRKLCNMAAAGLLTGDGRRVPNRFVGDFWNPRQCVMGPKMVSLKTPTEYMNTFRRDSEEK